MFTKRGAGLALALLAPAGFAAAVAEGEAERVSRTESLKLQGQGQAKELAILPIPRLVRRLDSPELPSLGVESQLSDQDGDFFPDYGPFHIGDGAPRAAWVLGGEGGFPAPVESVMEVLRDWLGYERFDERGTSLSTIDGSQLLVVLDAPVLQNVRAALDGMRHALVPRIRVEYVLFEGAELPGGVLAAKDARERLERLQREGRGRILYQGRATGRTGDLMRLGQKEIFRYLGDIDVEVAQDSGIGYPKTLSRELGHCLGVRAIQIPGSDELAFFGVWSNRTEEGIELLDLQARKLRSLESVRIRHRQALFSTRMAPGQAYVWSPVAADGPDVRAMFVCERLDAPAARLAPQNGRIVHFVPSELLKSRALRAGPGAGEEVSFAGMESGVPALGEDMLVDLMRNLLGDAGEQGLTIRTFGSHLALVGTPELVERAQSIPAFAATPLRRAFSVVLQLEAQAEGENGTEFKAVGEPLRIECLGGRFGMALRGVEKTVIYGYDVEIAQESVMADPKVASVFDGVHAFASCEPSGDGVHVRVMMLDRALREIRKVQAATDNTGSVTIPRLVTTRLDQSLDLQPGEKQVLGGGVTREMHGRMHRTRYTVQLLER